jgi:tryptophan synthase beta subunit
MTLAPVRRPCRVPSASTPAARPRSAARENVLGQIAARRRADLATDLAALGSRELRHLVSAAPAPRPIVPRLAAAGLQVIAELKRSSPSAGTIAAPGDDLVARARAYERGGAAAISVLCEPHWFGGSVDDLRSVRAAVAIPVLAKEFVVDSRQLPLLRAAGADLVLLLAALHRPAGLRQLVRQALDLGLEPLVEVHDEREADTAAASGARVIGLNNRNLKTLEVDTERAPRLLEGIPRDRLVVAESGVRDSATIRDWRALGFDAALVGEALVRSSDPEAATRAFVAAGMEPADLANVANRPMVKICGVRDLAGAEAALAAGADAIGLNLVPGTPRAMAIDDAAELAAAIRRLAPTGRRPRIVAVTVDRSAADLGSISSALDPDVIQLSGDESPAATAISPRPAWKVLHVPAGAALDAVALRSLVELGRTHLAAGAEHLMLDAAGGVHPGGTGLRLDPGTVAAIARELPIILAGGLTPVNVTDAIRTAPIVGVDVASGVEGPRVEGERPVKDPLRVALFVKRARFARDDRPTLAARPSAVDPRLEQVDRHGRWGLQAEFGGRYVPETLIAAIDELDRAYARVRDDPRFWAELRERLESFAGRPTPLVRADRLAEAILARARDAAPAGSGNDGLTRDRARTGRAPRALRLYLKREDLAHTGAHKINNALGQALLTRRLGKTRVIAETGAGQHGVATATACALLGLPCIVYMGAEDIERQQPNVLRMHALGAEVRSVTSGSATLKDAINEAMRDWVTNVATTHYVLGSAMGPHPYPTIVRDLQRRIGDEAAAQLLHVEGRLPDLALACVGGGSNAIGLLSRFIGEPTVRLAVAEAAGDGLATGRHAAALAGGTPGILHGARSMMLQDEDGQVVEAHSASAGLDYPGVGPQIAALAAAGRLELAAATDDEAFAAMALTSEAEGILPALETAHAIAALPQLLAGPQVGPHGVPYGGPHPYPDDALLLLGFSGRGDKDLAAFGRWREGHR